MSNKIIWKDTIKGYDICASRTDYGAIVMFASHTVFNELFETKSWLGGIKDLDEAKRLCLDYIDKNIVFEVKMKEAQQAYNAIMVTAR